MLKRFSLLAVLVSGLLLLQSSFAEAHAEPVRFEPPPGAVLQTAPTRVEGWFTQELRRDPNWNFIQVKDAQGNRVDTGEATLSADRLQMSVGLRPGLLNGEYVVTWRSWSDGDGEIVSECYRFFVGMQAATNAASSKVPMSAVDKCDGFEFAAKNGTPTPKQVDEAIAEAKGASGPGHHEGGTSAVLVGGVALIVGLMGGLAGGYFVGRKS